MAKKMDRLACRATCDLCPFLQAVEMIISDIKERYYYTDAK